MANRQDEDDDFLDLCEENLSPVPSPPAVGTSTSTTGSNNIPLTKQDSDELESYSDIEAEEEKNSRKRNVSDGFSSLSKSPPKGNREESSDEDLPVFSLKRSSASSSQIKPSEKSRHLKKTVEIISDESDHEGLLQRGDNHSNKLNSAGASCVRKTNSAIPSDRDNQLSDIPKIEFKRKQKSNQNREQLISMSQWHTGKNSSEMRSLTKRKSEDNNHVIVEDVSPVKKTKQSDDNTLQHVKTGTQTGKSDCIPKEIVVRAAIKLRELFPQLSASVIGDKIKALNDCSLSEEELVQTVVEDMICIHGNDNDKSEDVQIAIANPKIQVSVERDYVPVSKSKNIMTNNTKGKSLMKKVNQRTEDMDVDIDADFDILESEDMKIPVEKLEIIEVERNMVKLRWKPINVPSLYQVDDKYLRYIVETQTPPSKDWITLHRNIAGTVYVVSNLKPNQDYRFRIRASTRFGKISEPSPVAELIRNNDASETTSKSSFDDSSVDKVNTTATRHDEETAHGEVSSSTLSCEACQSITTFDKMVQCCDGHLNCNVCVEKVVKKVLSHGNEETKISCCCTAWYDCSSYIPESQAKKVLPSLVFELLEEKINKKASEDIEKMFDVYSCPSCQFKVTIEDDMKKFECPQCKVASCRYCSKTWNTTNHKDCTLNTSLANRDMDVSSTLTTLPEGYKDFIAVELGQDSSTEYNFVLSLFHKENARAMNRIPVTRIFRIQNPRLYEKYSLYKNHMIQDIGKDNINEQHLFHGTATAAVGGICRDGLDWRMCGVNGTAFGQGTYFAKNSSYSLKYSSRSTANTGSTNVNNMNRNRIMNAISSSIFGFSNYAIPMPAPPSSNSQGNFALATTNNNQIPSFNLGPVSVSNSQNTGFNFGVLPSSNSQNSGFTFGTAPTSNTQNTGFLRFNSTPQNLRNVFTFGANPVNSYSATGGQNRGAPSSGGFEEDSVTQSTNPPIEELFIDKGKRYMFLARVLVGQSCLGVNGMRKPPRDDQNRQYNSACDNAARPSIFVIFDSSQSYPEYLIEF